MAVFNVIQDLVVGQTLNDELIQKEVNIKCFPMPGKERIRM